MRWGGRRGGREEEEEERGRLGQGEEKRKRGGEEERNKEANVLLFSRPGQFGRRRLEICVKIMQGDPPHRTLLCEDQRADTGLHFRPVF